MKGKEPYLITWFGSQRVLLIWSHSLVTKFIKLAGSGLNVAHHVSLKWTDVLTCLLQKEEAQVRRLMEGHRSSKLAQPRWDIQLAPDQWATNMPSFHRITVQNGHHSSEVTLNHILLLNTQIIAFISSVEVIFFSRHPLLSQPWHVIFNERNFSH